MTQIDHKWISMQSPRKLSYATKEWIPVYGMRFKKKDGKYPTIGFSEDFEHVETGIVINKHKAFANDMSWSDWDQDSVTPYISDDKSYQKTGNLYNKRHKIIGERIVMGQYIDAEYKNQIYINQDFILAYKLVKRGDGWICPKDGDRLVIRSEKFEDRSLQFVEIRSEYLKDYLSARDASLRLYFYRERQAVVENKPSYIEAEEVVISDGPHNRCTVTCHKVTPSRDLPNGNGGEVKLWRNDLNEVDTITDYNQYDDDGRCHSSRTFINTEIADQYHLYGRLWRGEWISGNKHSRLNGYSEPDDDLKVQADNSGEKVQLSSLRYEEVNKYLWFKPEVVRNLTSRRGGRIAWDTNETGYIYAAYDSSVHFGLNSQGLISVYAYDIAKLPYWQREIWVGHNCPPNDGVSKELLKIQIECAPVRSSAPEKVISLVINHFDSLFRKQYSLPVLQGSNEAESLVKLIDRFRVNDDGSLESLAKNLVKFTLERISKRSLRQSIGEPKLDCGSIGLLERLLAKNHGVKDCQRLVNPLRDLNRLQQLDSHLRSENTNIEGLYQSLGIDRTKPYVWQGAQLIKATANSFIKICESF